MSKIEPSASSLRTQPPDVPQFQLRTLLLFVFFISMALAWFVDHRSLSRQLADAKAQVDAQRAECYVLRKQLATEWSLDSQDN
jgi:hypothetical protein